MKSHIRNKSELIELRYCYLLLLYNFTIFLSVGYTRELWFQVLLLPFVRIIPLFSTLFEKSGLLAKIFQFILITFIILFCLISSFRFIPVANGFWFYKVFYGAILITIIFHRYIFFSNIIFLDKYLVGIYRILKKYCVDILFVLASYIFVYRFLPGDSNSWGLVFNTNHLWYTLRLYIYIYTFYIIVALIWHVVYDKLARTGVRNNKMMKSDDVKE